MKKIIAFLLALIGIHSMSCDNPVAEYGCPYAEFHVNGYVKNIDNQPINNIRIVMKGDNQYDTLYTDANGIFDKTFMITPWIKEYECKAEDIDSNDNGGFYKETTKIITITEEDFIGESEDWYAGKVTKNIEFTLTHK